jgi:hypothetical protein
MKTELKLKIKRVAPQISLFSRLILIKVNRLLKFQYATLPIFIFVFGITKLFGQYGEIKYTNAGFGTHTLSSAKFTSVNLPGYLTSGYNSAANSSNGHDDFVIKQVDDYDLEFIAAGTWGKRYQILDDINGCPSPNPVRTYNCRGVYAIEASNSGSGEVYVLAGAYDDGVFFATLDATGNVTSTFRWQWVGNVFNILPPMITASSNAGQYYICGTVGNGMYVIKYDVVTSSSVWAKYFNSSWCEGRALIESPSGSELIVVGRYDDPSSGAAKGSFLQLDPATGAVIGLNLYGFNNGTHADDWFNCIAPATSTTGGGSGYIIGGRAYDPSGAGNHNSKNWMIKLDLSGNVIWSTLIEPHNGGDIDEGVQDVFERYNANGETYKYEYYGVSVFDSSPSDTLLVWKLDDIGGKSWVSPNEMKFVIGDGIGNSEFNSQIECVGDGSNTGDGFGAWSTDINMNDHVFFKNYFNGANSCNELSNTMKVYQGPGHFNSQTPTDVDLFEGCQSFTITSNSLAQASVCWTLAVWNGQNKIANITGVEKNDLSFVNSIYPNPSSDKVVFTFSNPSKNQRVNIKIQNSLGQTVYSYQYDPKGNNEKELDLSTLGISSGTYYLVVDIDGRSERKKLVYIK